MMSYFAPRIVVAQVEIAGLPKPTPKAHRTTVRYVGLLRRSRRECHPDLVVRRAQEE